MIIHTITQTDQTSPSQQLSGQTAVTGDTEMNSDVLLPPASVDVVLSQALTLAKVQSLALACTGATTVHTYNEITLRDTITFAAAGTIVCASTAAVAALFPGGDFTSIKLTSTPGALFSLRSLVMDTMFH